MTSLATAAFSVACAALPPSTPPPTSSPQSTVTASPRYTPAFGIDYAHPEKYLSQGEQTRLAKPELIDALRGKDPSIAHLGQIYFWIKREFTPWSAGGRTIGKFTTDQLFAERRLGGCHDWGLVYASIARALGYPVVMIDTAGLEWAKKFRAGKRFHTRATSSLRCLSRADGCWSIPRTTGMWPTITIRPSD